MSKEKILSTTKFMSNERKLQHLIRRLHIARTMCAFSTIKLLKEVINECKLINVKTVNQTI